MQKLLGVDYGDKRIGLALGETGGLALPFKVIANKGQEYILGALQAIIKEENIGVLVVGWPRSMSGQDNERSKKTSDFVNFLKDNLTITVATVDERLTSKLYSRQGIRTDIDKHSAAAILETYLANYER